MSFENGIVGLIIVLLGMLGDFVFNLFGEDIKDKALIKKRLRQSITVGIIFTTAWALIFAYFNKNRAEILSKEENEILLYTFISTMIFFYLTSSLYTLIYKKLYAKFKSKKSEEETHSVENGQNDDEETHSVESGQNNDEETHSVENGQNDENSQSEINVRNEDDIFNLSERYKVNVYMMFSLAFILIIIFTISNLLIPNPKSVTVEDSIVIIDKQKYILPKKTTFKFDYVTEGIKNETPRLFDYKYDNTEYVLKKGTNIILFAGSELYKEDSEKIIFKNNMQYADAKIMTNKNTVLNLNIDSRGYLLSDVRVKINESNQKTMISFFNCVVLTLLLIIYYCFEFFDLQSFKNIYGNLIK